MNNVKRPTPVLAHIACLLSCGAENGISTRHLTALTNLSEREIRLAVQRDRLNGIPVLSDAVNGYYLPSNIEEVERCVRSLRHRAREISRAADAIEQSARNGDSNGG